jgi:hypothetical protein
MIVGVILMIVGVTLLSDPAQGLVTLGGAVVFIFAAVAGPFGKSWDRDRKREPPVPPGSGGYC